MIYDIVLYLLIVAIGLCIGSFLNCVIYRMEEKKSLKGRSFCPNCKHGLIWKDLFPVFSFLFLMGKCRYCKKAISWQYPLVEIFTALVFLAIFKFLYTDFLNIIFLFYAASALIVIFVYDLKHYLIPDRVLLPAIFIAIAYNLIALHGTQYILYNFIAAIFASGFFLFIFLISAGRWMGFGDVKLSFLMGFVLGLPNIFAALFLAFFLGAIIGITMMFLKKKSLKSEIPFGPFLITGTFLAMLWGGQIVNWYLKLLI